MCGKLGEAGNSLQEEEQKRSLEQARKGCSIKKKDKGDMKGNRPKEIPRRQADYLRAPPLTWVQACGLSVPAVCCDILSTAPPGPLHSLWAGGVRN